MVGKDFSGFVGVFFIIFIENSLIIDTDFSIFIRGFLVFVEDLPFFIEDFSNELKHRRFVKIEKSVSIIEGFSIKNNGKTPTNAEKCLPAIEKF